MKIIFLILLLSGCSYFEKHERKTATENANVAGLKSAFDVRLAAYNQQTAVTHGWPSFEDCDGTIWAGKALAAGADTDLSLAEYNPGEIHRRIAPACWNEVDGDIGSKSTTSNDMILGYILGNWRTKNLDALKRLADYGSKNNWVMGKPYPEMASRVVLKPNQIGLLGRAIYALSGGSDDRAIRKTPVTYFAVSEDYEQHLQALGIVLYGEVDDQAKLALTDVTGNMVDRLNELVAADPDNALFHAALGTYTGDLDRAIELLMDESTPAPGYVRGEIGNQYHLVEWLFAADLVLVAYGH